jgi:hypothetical protein
VNVGGRLAIMAVTRQAVARAAYVGGSHIVIRGSGIGNSTRGLANNIFRNEGNGGDCGSAPAGTHDRGPNLGQQQGREFRTDQLGLMEFDPNIPAHVRGWLRNERRMIEQGRITEPRTPSGYQMGHGRTTPAREGYDYSNSRLQSTDLNALEESVRRAQGIP